MNRNLAALVGFLAGLGALGATWLAGAITSHGVSLAPGLIPFAGLIVAALVYTGHALTALISRPPAPPQAPAIIPAQAAVQLPHWDGPGPTGVVLVHPEVARARDPPRPVPLPAK